MFRRSHLPAAYSVARPAIFRRGTASVLAPAPGDEDGICNLRYIGNTPVTIHVTHLNGRY